MNKQRTVKGTPVVSIPATLLPLGHFKSIALFIVWGVWAILIAFFDALRGRWWHALLLNQAALSAQVRLQDPENWRRITFSTIPAGFIVHCGLMKLKNEIRELFSTFYSTNCESFKREEGYPPLLLWMAGDELAALFGLG